MKFLQYKDSQDWWEWPDDEGMTVYNCCGGHHDIDENSEEFMYGKVITADSWGDLCRKENYNPWHTDEPCREMWIDPNGEMYECGEWGAHEATACIILKVIFDKPQEYWDAGDQLIQRGWIKVTCGPMNRWYQESDMYKSMTDEQYTAYTKWENKYNNKTKWLDY